MKETYFLKLMKIIHRWSDVILTSLVCYGRNFPPGRACIYRVVYSSTAGQAPEEAILLSNQ